MTEGIIIAIIACAQGVIVAAMGAFGVTISRQGKRTREVHEQVVNHHGNKSILRDDIDHIIDTQKIHSARINTIELRLNTNERSGKRRRRSTR